MEEKDKIGIIAGGGHLPFLLRDACIQKQQPYFILALQDQADPALCEGHPHAWIRLGAVGTGLKALHDANATAVVLGGAVKRPSWCALRPDKTALKWLAKMGQKSFGDDGILSGIVRGFEKEGFKVIHVHDVLPGTIVKPGVLGVHLPTSLEQQDIERGIKVAKQLGILDIGQAVVVEEGIILAVEAIEGTQAMLERCYPLKRTAKGGVLVKACKPQQEKRVDLPSIGPDTITQAAACGLRGIAVEAYDSLILHMEETIKKANDMGLFVYGFQ